MGAGDEVIMSIAGHVSRAMISRYSRPDGSGKRRFHLQHPASLLAEVLYQPLQFIWNFVGWPNEINTARGLSTERHAVYFGRHVLSKRLFLPLP
jgi:hypothetical protein